MKNSPLLFLVFALLLAVACAAQEAPRYAVALRPTPVLNTPDFAGVFGGPDGKTLRTDACGQIRALEFVALPGTPFAIEEVIGQGTAAVYRVVTDDYPYPTRTGYFIDSRFVATADRKPQARRRTLPPRADIIANLLSARGSAYVWGGNLRSGVPELLSFFPPRPALSPDQPPSALWQLRGVDCSGLLYEATGGFTPRNTSALVTYGRPVPVAGLTAAAITGRLEPLDLIAWPGHVLIVLDRERVIESRLDCRGTTGGVKVRPLRPALEEIMDRRAPADGTGAADLDSTRIFVVRRWYSPAASAHR